MTHWKKQANFSGQDANKLPSRIIRPHWDQSFIFTNLMNELVKGSKDLQTLGTYTVEKMNYENW